MKKISAFLPYDGFDYTNDTVKKMLASGLVEKVWLLSTNKDVKKIENAEVLNVEDQFGNDTVKLIAEKADAEFTIVFTKDTEFDFGQYSLERFINLSNDTNAGMVYSDYYEIKGDVTEKHPVIDYQLGSLRDDFNFGYVMFYKTEVLKEAASRMNASYKFAGLYDLRLKASQKTSFFRIPEFLYTAIESDLRKSGEKNFDYVDPKNRAVQIEMEEAVTDHLKDINGYLKPEFKEVDPSEGNFEFDASVVIPVKNRAKTIKDAIESVLSQKTDYKFNLIIVDNYSDDGTSEIIKEYAAKDERLIHLVPERKDLQIGGCWNEGVHHEKCGRYAIQLDSDDVYANENTIQTVVETFHKEKCAMIVGTYQMTNFKLEEIPPGIIDHKEWTPENGRNNALRINGLGAPRAFYTPVLRDIKIPNVSYGEDYALGLRISREYQIGRIYVPIYMCRRWDGNSDAALPVEKINAHNTYKDRIRTIELSARVRKNEAK